jgi:hypothetical protein
MAIVVNQAPVAFSAMTSGSGTSAQVWQVSSTGTSAGVTAGNLYLDSASSNLLNGRRFQVSVGGWVKAHGATQTFAPGLQIFPWNTTVAGGRTASGTATYTSQASGTLTAGTFYDFVIMQEFFGEANANTLICLPASVYVNSGTAIASTTAASPITVSFASASQTEPITGINATTDYPLASFAVTFANSVSDTVETMQLTSFSLQVTV